MLRDLADGYVLDADLRVRALVASDTPYGKKTATVSVLRARPSQEDEGVVWTTASEVHKFRDDGGEPNLDPQSVTLRVPSFVRHSTIWKGFFSFRAPLCAPS